MYPRDADFMNSPSAARVNGYLGGFGKSAQLEKEIDILGLTEASKQALRAEVQQHL
jgi:peptide-methionine (S)-S-oxide reductase